MHIRRNICISLIILFKNTNIPSKFITLSLSIGELKNKALDRQRIYTDAFNELEKIAKVQSVKSSNAIEGIITSDSRIQEIVNKTVRL